MNIRSKKSSITGNRPKNTGGGVRIDTALSAGAESILESISDGVFTIDQDWRVTSFNRAAESITGIRRQEAVGKPCAEVFRASTCESDCALRHTIKTGRPVINKSAFIINTAGRRIPISVSTAILRDARGRVVGGAETFRDLRQVEQLRKELSGRFQMGDMVSCSALMRRVFDILPPVASSQATVMILGETGTGKELLARAIHNLGPRRDRPFVAVNCGALPDTLLESELFGHVRGAFTGAERDRPGRFARAEGGTIFLDEIGDISRALQVRLLRVLQERVYEPLGGIATVPADVRVIAATHRDLPAEITKGAFRDDLYYRLNVVRLELPPLRRRKVDIPLLIDHFIERFNHLQNRAVKGVAPDAMALLMAHDYPGNVRELENIMERAFVVCDQPLIGIRHLPPELSAHSSIVMPVEAASMALHRQGAEIHAIYAALQRHNYNRQVAARALGMHKCTLFRKIRKLGITLPEQDGRSRAGRKTQ